MTSNINIVPGLQKLMFLSQLNSSADFYLGGMRKVGHVMSRLLQANYTHIQPQYALPSPHNNAAHKKYNKFHGDKNSPQLQRHASSMH